MANTDTPEPVPPCFKVGCDKSEKHAHVGPISKNERVVVTAKLDTAPGWAYTQPHGRYLGRDDLYAIVALDDGTTRRVSPQNVVRERLWKPPSLRRQIPRPIHRPHKPLPGGPWQEVEFPFDEATA